MTENLFTAFIEKNGVVILDGGLATELERRGAELDDPLWSAKILLEAPEIIRQVHLDYLKAGADVITTASYQASPQGFEKKGLSKKKSKELLELSVRLAMDARDEFLEVAAKNGRLRPLVAASIGPYGAYLADGSEYRGDYGLSEKELMDFHRRRMEILATAGADLLAFETIPCLLEAEALAKLLQDFPGKCAWMSFSCQNDSEVSHGEAIQQAAALAASFPQIVAVGVNCTSPVLVENLLRLCSKVTLKPLVAYPNSGEKWDAAHHCWLPADAKSDFTELAGKWYAAGARLIGGCCRTTPDDIKQLANWKRSISG